MRLLARRADCEFIFPADWKCLGPKNASDEGMVAASVINNKSLAAELRVQKWVASRHISRVSVIAGIVYRNRVPRLNRMYAVLKSTNNFFQM